ncbi:MAG: hypothetical protein LBS31_11970 [Candidatus Adiutrix sp.]|nr:hypothetical protein [Candidatus Adiutrix sp.]
MPGAVFLTIRRVKTSWPRFLVVVFGLSAAINSTLVFLLALSGWYVQGVLAALFTAEFILLIYFHNWKRADVFPGLDFEFVRGGLKMESILAVGLLAISLIHFGDGLGRIFVAHDAVASWNRWAMDLAANRLPVDTYGYPQLLPALMSLPYVFMNSGYPVPQFFSYAVCLCFFPATMAACCSLYNSRNRTAAVIVVALVIMAWARNRDHGNLVGYADFPAMALGFMSFCALLWSIDDHDERQQAPASPPGPSPIFFSLSLGAAAIAAKQSGLLLPLLWVPAWQELVRKKRRSSGFISIAKTAAFFLAIALPWYLYNHYQIQAGDALAITSWVTEGIHNGRSLGQRAALAWSRWPGMFIFALMAAPGLLIRGNRAISAFGLSSTGIWACYYSYDLRNAAMGIPFIGLSCGLTLQRLYDHRKAFNFESKLSRHKQDLKRHLKTCLAVIVLLLSSVGIIYSDEINNNLQRRQQRKALWIGGRPEINRELLAVAKNDKAVIITDSYMLRHVSPDIAGKIASFDTYLKNEERRAVLENLLSDMVDREVYFYFLPDGTNFFLRPMKDRLIFIERDQLWLYRYVADQTSSNCGEVSWPG